MYIHTQSIVTLNTPKGLPEKAEETETEQAQGASKKSGYTLSDAEREKLSGRETKEKAEKTDNSDMPENITKMIEQLEKLKEQLTQQKEQLLALKAQSDQDEALQSQIKAQATMITSLQTQMFTLVQIISEAMKEAGVTDTGALVSAMV